MYSANKLTEIKTAPPLPKTTEVHFV